MLLIRMTAISAALALLAAMQPGSVVAAGLPLELVAGGFSHPTFVTNAGDERLFVVEQTGKIKIVGVSTPFLDLTALVKVSREIGLLGLAFHPDYATNGLFYVYYTRKPGAATVVAEYMRSTNNPDRADPSSARTVLKLRQSAESHVGGWIGFNGPLLYIVLGDGFVRPARAQKLGNLYGKILRIDPLDPDGGGPKTYSIPADNPYVGQQGARGEIWARGLRSPWRCSFDRLTADLWCGDVGQSKYEEVNRAPDGPGINYGWPLLEGFHYYKYPNKTPGNLCTGQCYDLPVTEFSHGKGCSVTGGYVSRREGAALAGTYLFGDFCTGKVWAIPADFAAGAALPKAIVRLGFQISTFGEDFSGRLYLANYQSGAIYRLSDS